MELFTEFYIAFASGLFVIFIGILALGIATFVGHLLGALVEYCGGSPRKIGGWVVVIFLAMFMITCTGAMVQV